MSFWKNYPDRKDWRKPRRGADRTCYSHGGCPYCENGRKHRERRQTPIVELPTIGIFRSTTKY